ncbi:RCC1 domain-containing protein [Rickettsiella endosymbiont of Dermanyssus gallinae]|uniref:RCC1 domain-containing protein n=1 Tax=Rickettsiella endosymbiont of Dermanyssus gallinae TaxID=2856608 RepID=UPI001C531EF5|nr:chromosome condensation regulator RCC1 [Rickettsiella endosymbiont of Dermanyssus gallinae]
MYKNQHASNELKIKQVACGQNHSLILLDSGRVFAMGSNQHKQLGLFAQSNYFTPTEIVNIEPIDHLSVGFAHSLLLSKNKTLWAMGSNSDKQLAFKEDSPEQLSLQKVSHLAAITQIIATDFTSAILEGQSIIHRFGIPALKPHRLLNDKLCLLPDWVVMPENFNVVDISVAQRHALLLTTEGEVYGLGSNEYGLLGLGDVPSCETWTKLDLPCAKHIKATSLGSVVLTLNHALMVSGINSYQQFSSAHTRKIIPQFETLASGVSTFDAYDSHTLYVAANQLFALGCNDKGQLGLGELNGQKTALAALKPFILAKPVIDTHMQTQIKKPELAFFMASKDKMITPEEEEQDLAWENSL